MEIVTDSSIRSAEEAYACLTKIRQVVRYRKGASTGDMEKRCIRSQYSIRPQGAKEYGTKVEVKTSTFRAVRNAIGCELRPRAGREEGGQVRQVAMGWDEHGATREQRSKETSEDYRYFPNPTSSTSN